MPQVQLPIFPAGSVEINRELACRVEGERVVYFNGHLPVFAHGKSVRLEMTFTTHYVINSVPFATMEGLLMRDTYPGFPYSLP